MQIEIEGRGTCSGFLGEGDEQVVLCALDGGDRACVGKAICVVRGDVGGVFAEVGMFSCDDFGGDEGDIRRGIVDADKIEGVRMFSCDGEDGEDGGIAWSEVEEGVVDESGIEEGAVKEGDVDEVEMVKDDVDEGTVDGPDEGGNADGVDKGDRVDKG